MLKSSAKQHPIHGLVASKSRSNLVTLYAQVAIKTLYEDVQLDKEELEELRKQLTIHANLRFLHIVQLIGACTMVPQLFIVTELAPYGSLYSILHTTGPVQAPHWEDKVYMLWDVARAVEFLHQCNPVIMHQDLRSANVLIFSNCCAKVADFGLPKIPKVALAIASNLVTMATPTGAYAWMAPEVMDGEPYGVRADIYSMGMIMYEVVSGKLPFHDHSLAQLMRATLRGRRPEVADADASLAGAGEIIALLHRCCMHDTGNRPGSKEVSTVMRKIVHSIGG
ncbi:kinase-like domain-containing protein, partial [Tribonema minus]